MDIACEEWQFTEGWVGVSNICWHLLEVAHDELARDAENCRGYGEGKHTQPPTLAHGIGHGEQAYSHEDVDLQRMTSLKVRLYAEPNGQKQNVCSPY